MPLWFTILLSAVIGAIVWHFLSEYIIWNRR